VLNNWAYSLCQFDQGPAQYRLAVEKATRALELSPTLRPAFYNRAVARFFLTRDPATQTVFDPRCLTDIETVLAGGDVPAELHYHAAAILAASAGGDAAKLDRAVRHLEQAVALGRNPRSVTSDPVLVAHLSNHPRYRALTTAAPVPAPPGSMTNLLLMPPTPE